MNTTLRTIAGGVAASAAALMVLTGCSSSSSPQASTPAATSSASREANYTDGGWIEWQNDLSVPITLDAIEYNQYDWNGALQPGMSYPNGIRNHIVDPGQGFKETLHVTDGTVAHFTVRVLNKNGDEEFTRFRLEGGALADTQFFRWTFDGGSERSQNFTYPGPDGQPKSAEVVIGYNGMGTSSIIFQNT